MNFHAVLFDVIWLKVLLLWLVLVFSYDSFILTSCNKFSFFLVYIDSLLHLPSIVVISSLSLENGEFFGRTTLLLCECSRLNE